MSRRSNGSDDSSLELLLDTICNTFGGVLFIALLVIILLNTTSNDPTQGDQQEVSNVEILKEENRRQKLTAEMERLQKIDENNKSIIGNLVSADLLKLAQKTKNSQRKESQLTRKKSDVVGNNANTYKQMSDTVENAKKRKEGIDAERKRASALKKKLDEVVKNNTKEAVIPKESNVDDEMQPRLHFLKQKTLYSKFTTEPLGSSKVFVERKSPSTRVTGKSAKPALRSHFGNYRPKDHFIHIFVWEDSFPEFEFVREVMEEKKLKYALVVKKKDEKVYVATGPTSKPKVQN